MYHGVPVVGVPLFGDHYDTMTRVAAKGMGIMLHWKYMTEEDLFTALTSVIKDTRLDLSLTGCFVYYCVCLSVTSEGCVTSKVQHSRAFFWLSWVDKTSKLSWK